MIRRKLMLAVTALFAVGLVAGPIAADEFTTGQEWEDATLECRADRDYPDTQDAPTGSQCAATHAGDWEDEEPETYQGRQWDNEVRCYEGAAPTPVTVDADFEPSMEPAGGAGICNDDESLPVQGRVVAGGSWDHGGFYAYADGTDSNPEPADGWVRADATVDDMVTAGCGPDGGKRDATAGDAYDVDNCG